MEHVKFDNLFAPMFKYLTERDSVQKKFNYWVHMPDRFKTELRNKTVLKLH